eukprot:CAMPEP_0114352000 /NCGR_PEP_ID=MMETSP0101-20121206/17615_1 /TAXON_ID=38822 ORGANISM="Pteridomonas danica, Strain PT" /NCGR_SAMPLE_ID=MMETSP0101 /ASSEMBLY_ACC=CAM_ASM_000211 /LENGTH=648 /DNA_ID=CAMNT_0001492177 /DNA_START=62 /DNA_END=2008 /DNA_ORIENTATION=+
MAEYNEIIEDEKFDMDSFEPLEKTISPRSLSQSSRKKLKLVLGGIALVALATVGSKSIPVSSSNLSEEKDKKITKSKSVKTSPNVILFTVDDFGWNDVGYNSGDISEATPFMKEIVKKSIKLTRYYTQPSCTPSRVTMMTGKFAYKNGFQNYELQQSDYVGVPLSNKLMPHYMRDLGYKTVGFGKWNIGHCNEKYLPSARGFDHFLGYLCPGHGYVNHNCGSNEVRDMIEGWSEVDSSGKTVHTWENGAAYLGIYDTLLYRQKSTEAIHKHFNSESEIASEEGSESSSSPLFMWMAHHGIHGEWDSEPVPPSELLTKANLDYLKVLKKRLDDVGSEQEGYSKFFKMRLITASVLMSIDNALKHLVETLIEVGEMSNSVILVNSDNGGDTYYTKGHPGNNYPLRSWKFSYYEGGVRVPAFVYAPGIIPNAREGGTYDGIMHHVDLVATFIHIGGGDVNSMMMVSEEDDDVDSINMWQAILDDSDSPRDEIVLNLPRSREWKIGSTETDEGVALIVGKYKILTNTAHDNWFSPSLDKDFHSTEFMKAFTCECSFYTHSSSSECSYSNFLFNIIEDPNEKENLWDDPAYNAIRENMIKRAETLVSSTKKDYGKIVPEYYSNEESLDKTLTSAKAFQGNDDYVVPFQCAAIP